MKKFMNKLKNKRYTISLLVTVLGLIGLISGTSYAILKGSTSASSVQIIKSGSVELKLTENFDNIDTGVSTMSDVDGLLQDDVYNFTISNIGTVSAKYDLKLVNEAPSGQTALSDEYVRVGLEVNGQEMGPMGLTNVNNIIDSTTIEDGEIVRYKLRVWFDESKTSELTGNTNKVYLKLKIEAKQAEYKEYQPEPGATVLYTDGTLIINEPTSQRQANITKHGAVTNEYTEMKKDGTDIEKYIFTSAADQPWNSEAASISKVEIGQKIFPTSTEYWFEGLTHMTQGDFTNLNTSRVTTFRSMFKNAGNDSSVTSFTLVGLDEWDVSNVMSISEMFYSSGYYATNWSVGNLSNWDTSNVVYMGSVFLWAGYNATTFNIGNLDNWNTKNVENMNNLFQDAGYNATKWNVGNLSNWDTSNVTNMCQLFFRAGYSATTWNIGNLNNWDVSKVTNMEYMFDDAGRNATTWSIGNLSSWDTSKVTGMRNMFCGAGYNATTWNSIGTLKIYATDIQYMFNNCAKAKATINLYSNPQSGAPGYKGVFTDAATASGALITVNYKSTTTNIDAIIATKSSNGNVVKGSVIS